MMKYRVGMLKNIRNYLSNKYWYLFIEDKCNKRRVFFKYNENKSKRHEA